MLFDSPILPGPIVIPTGIALAHLVLCFYVYFRRRLKSIVPRLMFTYLLLVILWDINLVFAALDLPGFDWVKPVSYGLFFFGLLHWAFTRKFLQRSGLIWGWSFGLLGFATALSLEGGWWIPPPEFFVWGQSWLGLNEENLVFMLNIAFWMIFMLLSLATSLKEHRQTEIFAYRNRTYYLIIATLLLTVGYSMFLTLQEPFWTLGLLTTWFGGALVTYIAVVDNLIDLMTAIRRLIYLLIAAVVTLLIYISGIYLVQIFLGDFLTTAALMSRYIEPALLVAAVTAVLLTLVHTPILRLVKRFTYRILFGQRYGFQDTVQSYSYLINNQLELEELERLALKHISQTLELDRGVLMIPESETDEQITLRILSGLNCENLPLHLVLTKKTPITNRFIQERQALTQYTIDVSGRFQKAPEEERLAMKALNFEWFIPILKKEQLVGLFALGPKKSKRSYTARDMRLLNTLADQTALALENAALFDRLKRTLAETIRMKNLMDNVFESINNGVITTDTVGKITLFNRAAETILAIPLEGSLGAPYTEALSSLANTPLTNLISNVAQYEDAYANYELVSELPNRGRVNLNLNLAPLKDADNQTQGVTIVMGDMTETKHLRAVKNMFRRYVSPAVVDRLPSDPADLQLGGHRQMVTILFADIRGFTTFSENLPPEQLVDILNEYLSMAARSILKYEGTLDKFMGDAVMGIFNAPLYQEDHIFRAVQAAVTMQRSIAEYHKQIDLGRNLSFGVGIHVGEAVVGNVGMSDRMDYTAIGDTVNLAKRIQENTPGNMILMSDVAYKAVRDKVVAQFYKEMWVKGRKQPVKSFELNWEKMDI